MNLTAAEVREMPRLRSSRYRGRGDVWMQVKRPMLRRLLAAQEIDGKPESVASVARRAGVSRSLIAMLASGKRKTCSSNSAHKIEVALGVGQGVVFDRHVPSVKCNDPKRRKDDQAA